MVQLKSLLTILILYGPSIQKALPGKKPNRTKVLVHSNLVYPGSFSLAHGGDRLQLAAPQPFSLFAGDNSNFGR